MATISRRIRPSLISRATAFAEQADDMLEIPEDLAPLSDEDLVSLSTRANAAFDDLYGDGSADLSPDDIQDLSTLTLAIEVLATEIETRGAAADARRAEAAELASRRSATLSTEDSADEAEDEESEDEAADEDDAADEAADEDEVQEPALVASGTKTLNLAATRRRAPKQVRQTQAKARTIRDHAYATTDTLGFADRAAIDFEDAGRMLDKRLQGFSAGTFAAAAARGQHLRQTGPLMALRREVPKDLIVASAAPEEVERAVAAAVDMSRLPGNSLVAAGWCAPSDNLFDLCYNESRDGLISVPEVQVNRGGINVPVNISFQEIYNAVGFHFTEADAEAGKWAPGANPGDPNVVGSKPCYEVECPEWVDHRLEGDGVCITGDLLQRRGFPEQMARIISGALVAHDHKVSAGKIAKMVAGSTAITMTTGTVGTTAPLLAAIELQVEHYRYAQRLSRGTILEAVFPYWVHGAIRQDLSVRLGIALFDVTDAQIDAWFRLRGIAPQFVYDWQALDQAATAFKQWPTTVQFLLYQAGTWLAGVDDIITLDTLYDSVLLGQNKYTALFTEEAWLIAKRCVDSRVITVPVCSDGTTHAGVLLDCNLTPSPVAP